MSDRGKPPVPAGARAAASVVGGVLGSLVRLGFYLGVAGFAVAVAVGRLSGPAAGGPAGAADRPGGAVLVDSLWLSDYGRAPRAFDPATATWSRPAFPADDRVSHARIAPWADAEGRSLVAACWMARRVGGDGPAGLAFYSYPDGEVVARVTTEAQVTGAPCWFPDGSPRVLYTGGDGVIYRAGLDPSGEAAPARPVAWGAARPGNRFMVREVDWPADPAWRGRLVAAIDVESPRGPRGPSYAGAQLWWLELNPEATAVVRAGRLTPPRGSGETPEERQPRPVTLPGGGPGLLYLTKTPAGAGWDLRAAAVEADPATGTPHTRPGPAPVLATGCAFVPPVPAPDGLRVFALKHLLNSAARMEGVPLPAGPNTLAATRPATAHATAPSPDPCLDPEFSPWPEPEASLGGG